MATRQPTSACSSYPHFFKSVSFHSKQIIMLLSFQFLSIYFLTIIAATRKTRCLFRVDLWRSSVRPESKDPDWPQGVFHLNKSGGTRRAYRCLQSAPTGRTQAGPWLVLHTPEPSGSRQVCLRARGYGRQQKNETSLNQLEQSLYELKDAKEASTRFT